MLEAHNSVFSYDIISLYETCLNDSVELPDKLLDAYSSVCQNNPLNTRRGGVGLFYKNSLPLKIRNDLAFDESIVAEINFGRKKIFFVTLYRSPSISSGTPEFQGFLDQFERLYAALKSENPYSIFISGDLNGHSELWWREGNTTAEGREIELLTSQLGLTQLIQGPINFEPNKYPSCIDLIFTDQPN